MRDGKEAVAPMVVKRTFCFGLDIVVVVVCLEGDWTGFMACLLSCHCIECHEVCKIVVEVVDCGVSWHAAGIHQKIISKTRTSPFPPHVHFLQ